MSSSKEASSFGSDEEAGRRVGRDHVRRLAAVGDDAVDAVAVLDVLAEGVDGGKRDDEGVEGVYAGFRAGRGVRLPAEVLHVQLDAGQRPREDGVARAGVEEHGRVQVVEGAAARHDRLAAVDLLRRRADDDHAAAGRRQHALTATAAPTELAAIRLWPQAWPRPGRASYSARKPTRGRSSPLLARKAVAS